MSPTRRTRLARDYIDNNDSLLVEQIRTHVLYAIPSHQHPMTVTMTLERRQALFAENL